MKKKAKNLLPKLGLPIALGWVYGCSTLSDDPPAKFLQDLKIAENRLEQAHSALLKEQFIQARRLAEAALLDTRVVATEWQTEQVRKLVKEERQHLNYLEGRQAEIKAAITERKTVENQAEQIRQHKDQLLRESGKYDQPALERSDLEGRTTELDKVETEQKTVEREVEQLQQRRDELLRENNDQVPTTSSTPSSSQPTQEPAIDSASSSQSTTPLPTVTEPFTEPEIQQTEQGLVVIIKNIAQPAGRVGLTAESMRTLSKVVNFLKENPQRTVLVRGYADSYGSEKYNLYLSQRRAEVIRSNLASKDIAVERISAKGYGSEYPTDYPLPSEGLWADVVILNMNYKPR